MKATKLISVLSLVVFINFLAGCASHNAVQLPRLSLDLKAQQEKADDQGFILMARPIHSQADLKTYFDNDLLSYGILPVQVHLLNRAYGKPVILSTDGVNLIDTSGTRLPMLSMNQLMDSAKKSQWRSAGWYVAFGIFGAIPSIVNVVQTNNKIQADYESRLLKGGNVIPGAATEGLVFFSVPADINSLNGWKMSVVLVDPIDSTNINIEHGLSGTVAPREQPEAPADPAAAADNHY
jgi:hypothetical protein